MNIKRLFSINLIALLAAALALVGLYFSSLYSYVLFHTLVELVTMIIAGAIFLLAWNTRHFNDNDYLLFIGISYLFVVIVDLTHTLAYKGMNIFQGYDSNLPTQLWITARYVQGISLLIAPFFIRRKLNTAFMVTVYALVTAALLTSIFSRTFPVCYIEGIGLTPFKIISEYVISAIILTAAALMLRERKSFERGVFIFLISSLLLTIGAELAFTFYVSVYGFSNLVGHIFKLIAFYCIYKAVIETGLRQPYKLLFRNLSQSKETLQQGRDDLELRVQERTAELEKTNAALQTDIAERKRIEQELRESQTLLFNAFHDSPLLMTISEMSTGKYLEVNDSFCRVSGFSREESIGKTSIELGWISAEERTRMMSELQQHGNISGLELILQSKSGKMVTCKFMGTIIQTAQGSKLFSTAEDITTRKQAEENLRESEQKYHAVVENANDGILVAQDGVMKFVNSRIATMFGYEVNEVQGREFQLLLPPENLDLIERYQKRLAGIPIPAIYETMLLHKNGVRIPVEINANIIQFEGKPADLVIMRDIIARKQADEKLKESEERFATIFRANPAAVAITRLTNSQLVDVNEAWQNITGYTLAEMVGHTPQELNLWASPEQRERLIGMLGEHGKARGEMQLRTKSGDIRNLLMSADLIELKNERYLLTMAQDITELKQTEEQLKEALSLLRIAEESAKLGGWSVDLERNRCTWSDEVAAIHEMPAGYSPLVEEGINFYAPEWREKISKVFGDCAQKGIPYNEEMEIITANGKRVWVQTIGKAVRDKEGRIYKVQGAFQDISERKQAEEALHKSEVRLRLSIENMLEGYALHEAIFDARGRMIDYRFLEFNPAAQKLSNIARKDIVGRTALELYPHIVERGLMDRYADVMTTGEPADIQDFYYMGDRLDKAFDISCFRIDDLHFVCVFRDVTERKQVNEKIRRLNTELEQRVQERTRELIEAQEKLVRSEKLAVLGQMASSVGHELRNPLAVLISSVYYLKMIQPDAAPKVREYLDVIEQEVRNSEKIITDLLDFARIKSVDSEAVSVSDLIRQTLERFPAPPSVEVTLDLPDNLPRVYVDSRQMIQVLGNLTINACQAMLAAGAKDGGRLTLATRAQNDMIIITVQDTGIGISAENMKKLFEPLFTTKTKGIGLGLAISRKLIEANGGRIEVESEVGRGSSFHVYLPIYKAVAVPARDDESK